MMADLPDENRPGNRRKPDRSRSNKMRIGGAKSSQTRSHLEVIERLLHAPVDVMKDGRSTKMPALGAIMYQLVQKSLAGDRKAERARQRFEAHALESSVSEFEIVFVDNDYTKAFAASRNDGDA